MDKKIKEKVIELLNKDEEIPAEFQKDLFPTKKKEYELVYAGKEREEKILNDVMSVPFQPIKQFGDSKKDEWSNMLVFGDNLQSLKHLLKLKEEGKLKNSDGTNGVRLVYIDPPFGTGDAYDAKGDKPAYSAKLQGVKYIEYLRRRLILLNELMTDDGIIFIRIDYHFGHSIKIILDEIFSKERFKNEIIVTRTRGKKKIGDSFSHMIDSIFFYSKNGRQLNEIIASTEKYKAINEILESIKDKKMRETMKDQLYECLWVDLDHRPGERLSSMKRIAFERSFMPPRNKSDGVYRHWIKSQKRLDELAEEGKLRLRCSSCSYIHKRGKWNRCSNCNKDVPVIQILLDSELLDDNWTDIPGYSQSSGYPTENSEILLERIIKSSSNPGDIVLDCFAGSGTTGAVAEKLGRKWIMCDCGKLSIYTIQKRMMNLKEEIGNKGKSLKHKPYTLYHAGLYHEKEIIEQMQNGDYKDFVLELFGCQKRSHKINGIEFHGTLNNHSVLIFDKKDYLTYDFIEDLHKNVGPSVKDQIHIIVPVGIVEFNEDYLKKGKVTYNILRIPNSIIDYIREKDFTKLEQPRTSDDVNQTIDAVGFDFVYPPNMKIKYSKKGKKNIIEILDFDPIQLGSKLVEFKDPKSEALAMMMIDPNYNGETFSMESYFFGDEIIKNNFKIELEKIGDQIMVIYIDIFGNERKEIVNKKEFK